MIAEISTSPKKMASPIVKQPVRFTTAPQLGQAFADFAISWPHSLHFVRAIRHPKPVSVARRRIIVPISAVNT
jgi:hypothetical protein